MKRISHRNLLAAFSLLGLLLLPGVELYETDPVSERHANVTEAGLEPAHDFDLLTKTVFASALATAYLDLATAITKAQGATWGDAQYFVTKAQANFDCWVHQSEEGLMGTSGETCQAAFEHALQSIDERIIAARQLTLAMASQPASASNYTGSIGN